MTNFSERRAHRYICLVCGTTFNPTRRSAGRYCSMVCVWSANKARAARNRELNPLPEPIPIEKLGEPRTEAELRVEALRDELAEAVRRAEPGFGSIR